ncbi:hypothetical protein EDB80DRAFT_869118 [Ilyonectria destructans]|nr:hypothetical protein EDB80DRAFT_869118 [Ilyonectria destructans]
MLCQGASKAPFRAFGGVPSVLDITFAPLFRLTRPRAASLIRTFLTSAATVERCVDPDLGAKDNVPSAVLHQSLKSAPLQVVSGDGKQLTFSKGHKITDTTCGAAVACIGYNNSAEG